MEEAKRRGLEDDNEVMGEDIVAWLSSSSSVEADDTMSDELMKLLETTSGGGDTDATCCRVKFIDNPYSFSMIFQPCSSYITINGNEESCGSSFSDADSSVMASVHMADIHVLTNSTLGDYVGANWAEEVFEMGSGGEAWGSNDDDDGMVVDGGDGFDEWVDGDDDDDFDDVLAGFLGD